MVEKVGRLTFVRQIYRRLLERGRTYAAFEKNQIFPIVKSLAHYGMILDPMSGYGTLMSFCAELGIESYSVELNPPSYYWQVLTNPKNFSILDQYLELIMRLRKLPKTPTRASITNEWFSDEGICLALELFHLLQDEGSKLGLSHEESSKYSLSMFLPFVSRFSSLVQGNIVIESKPGGICVFNEWEDDFRTYLSSVRNRIKEIHQKSKCIEQENILGDCRLLNLQEKNMHCFITSPSYPNYKDYYKIFEPENDFLHRLADHDSTYQWNKFQLIGSIDIKGRKDASINQIISPTTKSFLEKMINEKGKKKAIYDIHIYYYPYFLNFFLDLQTGYLNFIKWMSRPFEGYIVVVNNTSRKQIVPLMEFTVETFQHNGYQASIFQEREKSHVGTLNPIMKGTRARHVEYIIKVDANGTL